MKAASLDIDQVHGNPQFRADYTAQVTGPSLTPGTSQFRAEYASRQLASLMEEKLGVGFVSWDKLALLLQRDWKRIAALAHLIHEGAER